MKARFVFCLALAPFLSAPLFGQAISAVVNPNPAPLAGIVTITITAGSLPVTVGGCPISAVHQGSPSGPNVMPPTFCPAIVIAIAACGSIQGTWNTVSPSGQMAQPGDYWIRVDVLSIGTAPVVQSNFFPVTLTGAALQEPTLVSLTPAQIGQPFLLGIQAPSAANGGYIAAASFTTNAGLPITPTEYLALDIDFLFNLTFPNPNPNLFANLQGSLDASGNTNSIGMIIPFASFLQCTGMAWQAAVFGPNGLEFTNALSVTIQ